METQLKKWGNSLALRIPKSLAEQVGLYEDSPVALLLEEGRLVVAPIEAPTYTLEALLARVSSENVHREVDVGEPVGGEEW